MTTSIPLHIRLFLKRTVWGASLCPVAVPEICCSHSLRQISTAATPYCSLDLPPAALANVPTSIPLHIRLRCRSLNSFVIIPQLLQKSKSFFLFFWKVFELLLRLFHKILRGYWFYLKICYNKHTQKNKRSSSESEFRFRCRAYCQTVRSGIRKLRWKSAATAITVTLVCVAICLRCNSFALQFVCVAIRLRCNSFALQTVKSECLSFCAL